MVQIHILNSMSSDSSDEENLELLREAADNEFTKHLFNSNNGRIEIERPCPQPNQLRSLRSCDELKTNDLNVTPQSQKFFATRLSNYLDSEIKETKRSPDIQNKVPEGGIYLFSTSKCFVSCDTVDVHEKPPKLKHRKYYPKKSQNEVSSEEQLRDIAVSADWILSQESVRGWEKNTKGKLEVFSVDEVEIKIGEKECVRKTSVHDISLEEKQEKKRLKRLRSREKLKKRKFLEKNQ